MGGVNLPADVPARHPLDPNPARATKARAVFALGLVGFLTGVFVGGVIPATVGLLLARQAARDAYAAGGYLTGGAWVRRGRRLAWAGIVLALTTLVVAAIAGLLHLASSPAGPDFAPGTD
jgi:(hydroxyamino)benzene mutase